MGNLSTDAQRFGTCMAQRRAARSPRNLAYTPSVVRCRPFAV